MSSRRASGSSRAEWSVWRTRWRILRAPKASPSATANASRALIVEGGRVRGVETRDGERFEADAVVFDGDASALGVGLLGETACAAAPATPPARRSLSALTLAGVGHARGFPLLRHNVFFSSDYAREFDAIFARGRLPEEPTVYVCAADREDKAVETGEPERLSAARQRAGQRRRAHSARR